MINIYSHPVIQFRETGRYGGTTIAMHKRVAAALNDMFGKLQYRQAMKRFARFSDHGLQDVGFEREWDGSIQPLCV